jgi:GntR family transcriptional regulator, galactonate operon transcriptional repressor
LHQAVTKSLALKVIESSGGTEPLIFPSEAELCQQLGVSRSILREAVKVLSAKRMLEVRPKSGTRSRPRKDWNLLDPDLLSWQCEARIHGKFLEDLCELRLGIEPMASELAALRAAPDEIGELGKHLVAMESAIRNPAAFIEPDLQFHIALYRASRNELLQHLATIIRQSFRISLSYTTRLAGVLIASVPAHRRLFEAIEHGNSREARRASEELVRLSSKEIHQLIAKEQC